MSKHILKQIRQSLKARAREAAAARVQRAEAITRIYVDTNMKMLFPGEEVD